MKQSCSICGGELVNYRTLPIKNYAKDVYAIRSVKAWDCTNPNCQSGGSIYGWGAIGRLYDIIRVVDLRPLYVQYYETETRWVILDHFWGDLFKSLSEVPCLKHTEYGWLLNLGEVRFVCHPTLTNKVVWYKAYPIEGYAKPGFQNSSFEEALDASPESIRVKLLFHLDVFAR